MNDTLDVIKPGTKVTIMGGRYRDAVTRRVRIGPGHGIEYEIAWFNDGKRNVAWLAAEEVTTTPDYTESLTIGFDLSENGNAQSN